jgi:hypothetical protein
MKLFKTVFLSVLLSASGLLHAQENVGQVKSLFLYNFANFVRWPNEAFAGSGDKLRICIFGKAELGSFLDQVNGTRIRDKTLDLLRTSNDKDIASGCQVLFVGADKMAALPQLTSSSKHIYVLSVSDVENFAREGGVISIMRTTDHVSFEINLDVAISRGLLISSDLLSMARIVGRNGKPITADQERKTDTLLEKEPKK